MSYYETPLAYDEVKRTSTTKITSVGTRGVTPDGRKWSYVYAGSALAAASVIMTAPADKLGIAGNCPNLTTEDITSTFRTIKLTATASTWTTPVLADEYAGGYLIVEKSTHSNAAGQMVKIKGNTLASDTSTTGTLYYTTVTFDDADCLSAGLDTGSTGPTIQVIRNEYYGVVPFAGIATLAGTVVGVPAVAIASGAYGWVCTWGATPVLNEGTTVIGEKVIPTTSSTDGNAAIGCLEESAVISTGDTESFFSTVALRRPSIGYQIGPAPGDADYGLVFLTIKP